MVDLQTDIVVPRAHNASVAIRDVPESKSVIRECTEIRGD